MEEEEVPHEEEEVGVLEAEEDLQLDPDEDDDEDIDSAEEEDEEKEYDCLLCPHLNKFKGWNALHRHNVEHHAEADRTCSWCQKPFNSLCRLSSHVHEFHKHFIGLHERNPEPGNEWKELSLVEQMDELGLPKEAGKVLKNQRYLACFNKDDIMTRWTMEVIVPHKIKRKDVEVDKRYQFKPDERVQPNLPPQAINRTLGKELGHMSAMANHLYDNDAIEESFKMTNVMAMEKKINVGVWSGLEKFSRKLGNHWDRVTVIAGPIKKKKTDKVILPGGLKYPPLWGFFRIHLLERIGEPPLLQCFKVQDAWTGNYDRWFHPKFRTTLDEIFEETGMRFLSKIPQPEMTWDSVVSRSAAVCSSRGCYKSFSSKKILDAHIETHKGYYKCYQNCFIDFKTKEELHSHMKEVHARHPCEVCGWVALYPNQLKSHMLTHTGIKPFQCKDCNARFAQSGTLKNHIVARHTAEESRKKTCPTCKLEFNRMDKWDEHKKICHDQSKFYCKHCDAGLTTKGHLNTHLKFCEVFAQKEGRELPKYKCPDCNQRYANTDSLQKHMQYSCPVRKDKGLTKPPLKCPHCKMLIYGTNCKLQRHIKSCKEKLQSKDVSLLSGMELKPASPNAKKRKKE